VRYSQTPTKAGSYSVSITVTTRGYTGSKTVAFIINKATVTVNVPALTVTYDGASHHPVATTNPSGVAVTYSGSGTNAGTYTVTATTSNSNYVIASGSGTLTIDKRTAIFSIPSRTVDYDGASHGLTIASITNVAPGDDLSGSVDLGAKYTDPGTYTITWSFPGNTNYNSAGGGRTLTINEPPTTTNTTAGP
jgi:hypothetical protein